MSRGVTVGIEWSEKSSGLLAIGDPTRDRKEVGKQLPQLSSQHTVLQVVDLRGYMVLLDFVLLCSVHPIFPLGGYKGGYLQLRSVLVELITVISLHMDKFHSESLFVSPICS